jgi:multidrug efflux system outer membrane protein
MQLCWVRSCGLFGLFPSELDLASIRAQLYGSLVNLYKALGGGWIDKANELAPQPAAAALPPREPDASPARKAD